MRYQGALRYLDDTLATLMADETVQAALEDTLVVLWTDHGEQFYDHGASGHGHHLFTEENAALAAFAGSGLAPQRWTAPTSLLDLQPTILAALGLAPATVASGWQLGERDPDAPRYLLASTRQGPVQAIKTPSETLHYEWSGERSFYDRAADPAETLDLYDSQDDRVIALWELLEAEMLRVEALIPDQTPVSPGP